MLPPVVRQFFSGCADETTRRVDKRREVGYNAQHVVLSFLVWSVDRKGPQETTYAFACRSVCFLMNSKHPYLRPIKSASGNGETSSQQEPAEMIANNKQQATNALGWVEEQNWFWVCFVVFVLVAGIFCTKGVLYEGIIFKDFIIFMCYRNIKKRKERSSSTIRSHYDFSVKQFI